MVRSARLKCCGGIYEGSRQQPQHCRGFHFRSPSCRASRVSLHPNADECGSVDVFLGGTRAEAVPFFCSEPVKSKMNFTTLNPVELHF